MATIAVIMAMRAEAGPLIDELGAARYGLTPSLPMQIIEHWQPDVVISAGTAGGWSRSAAQIGDVFVAWPHVVRHDRRIGIEGFRDDGIGRHLVWADSEELAQHLDASKGVVTTSN